MYRPIAIDDETKISISKVLKYYRTVQKVKQSDFIRYRDASVCSADTYSRIENGKIIKRNSIYLYLLYQINATYEYFPVFWQQQQSDFQQLINQLTVFNMDNYQTLCHQIQEKLKNSKDFLAIEICEMLDVSLSFYNSEASLKEYHFEKYLQLYSIFPTPLQEIVKDMLYQNTMRYKRDLALCSELFKLLKIEDSHTSFLMIDQCRELMFEGRYLESHAIALQLEQQFQETNNIQRLLDVYEVMFILYRKVQHSFYSSSYLDKFYEFVHEYTPKLHHAKYLQSLYINGLLQYYHKNYKDAYSCFHTLANSHRDHYLPAAIFVNIIVNNEPSAGTPMLKPLEEGHPYPSHIAAFYNFFIMKKEKHSAEELESYVVHHVLPYFYPSDMVYWEPLRDELLELIKETKHYYIKKKLYIDYS